MRSREEILLVQHLRGHAVALWLFATLGLMACGAPVNPGGIEARDLSGDRSPQRFSTAALTEGALRTVVPAGQWRMLRVANLPPQDLYVASLPSTGARPYFGIGNGPELATISFTAPPEGRPYATPAIGWLRLPDGGPDSVIVLGSNGAATEFAIAYAPPDFDLTSVGVIVSSAGGSAPTLAPEAAEELALVLAGRPGVPARYEQGAGGYAGTIYRQRIVSGEVIEFSSGAISLNTASLASSEPGVELLKSYAVRGRAEQGGAGARSLIALTIVHSGVIDFAYEVHQPPRTRRDLGAGIGAGGLVPWVYLPAGSLANFLIPGTQAPNLHAGAVVDVKSWSPAAAGPARLQMDWRFSGREGARVIAAGSVGGDGEDLVRAFTPDIFWVDWGYVEADFSALYGWTLIEPLS